MSPLLWWRRRPEGTEGAEPSDQQVAHLAARADQIVDELDAVVKQLSDLLRKKHP